MDHARTRLREVESDLGRMDFEAQDWLTAPILDLQNSATTFFGRRHLAHLVAQQRMEWRAYVIGGIYKESNLHLPLTARIISQQSARAQKSYFGTSPWFAVSGLSKDSDLLAEDVHAYARHELDTLGGISSNLESAIDLTFIQGECVVKTRKNRLLSYFESWRDVAVDPATGKPFVAEDGDYIYKTDVFVQDMQLVKDEAGAAVLDEQGQEQYVATGKMVLKRDGKTVQPVENMAAVMRTTKLDLSKVLADQVEARPIYYLDFLCPLDAADIQKADFCAHLYNTSVIEMAHKYLTDEAFQTQDPENQLARIKTLVAEFLPGSAEDRQAAGDRARAELGEPRQSSGRAQHEPVVGLAECWLWFDPFGDGVMRSIMVLMDREGRIPIYYDYAANLTDDGLRPFDVMRINPPAGRWHGVGNVERFWNLQIYTDLLLNRAMFAESRAARVDFWNPSATIEGDANPNLMLNWGGTYRLKDGKTSDDALKPVYLTNIKSANLQNLLQLILQMAQNMSGVSNVNDGAMAGMDTAKLATGIRHLQQSGEEMFHQYITQLRPAIEAICRRALRVLLKNLPTSNGQSRMYKFFDRVSERMLEIDPQRLQDLDLDIKLELTTYRGESQLQQAQMGYNMVSNFLAQHPVRQQRLAPFVKQYLQAIECRDADTIAQPMSMEEWQATLPPAPALAPSQGDSSNNLPL